MTKDEALAIVEKADGRVRNAYRAPTIASWFFLLAASPLVYVPEIAVSGIFLELVLSCVTVSVTLANKDDKKWFEKQRAKRIWHFLHSNSILGHEFLPSTWQLKQEIDQLYNHDARGEILPLVQAIRLFDAHKRQQERLRIVAHRLEQLQLLRQTMHEKLAQLRKLGEDAPESQHRLTQLERDEAALQSIHNQISASCARLETIFTSVQHAHQVRQLKRELGELSQADGSRSDLALECDAFDIERQIGREIETFLQLERETDEHLRDV